MPDEEWKDPIDITKEQWMVLLKNKDIITEEDLRLLKALYDFPGCEARSPQLAQVLNMPHHAPINNQAYRLGVRIVEKLNILAPKYHNPDKYGEGFNWWNVPFWGEKRKGKIYWILRPELQEALQALDEEGALLLEITLPEEIDDDSHENLFEGAKKQVFVNSYERNRGARDRCIKYYGARCIICGFDFEKTYGEVGRDARRSDRSRSSAGRSAARPGESRSGREMIWPRRGAGRRVDDVALVLSFAHLLSGA